MDLSVIAKKSLKEILTNELGAEFASKLTDEEINSIGVLLLNILAETLRMNVKKI